MLIGFVEPHLKLVGGIRRIIEVTNRLIEFGHDVIIFTPDGRPCRWVIGNAPVYKLTKIRSLKFDVLLFNLAEQYHIVNQSSARLKVFWVLAPEATYKDPHIPIHALQQDFYFITNSNYTRNYILKHRKLNYQPPIIPGGINPKHFVYKPNIKKDFDVLYYGSKRPWKGTRIIEDALQQRNKIKTLKMEGLGTPQERMYTLYNRSTCFISACLSEGFSFPELEAMTCGCPVICTDSGGNRDFVKNNMNALVVRRDSGSIGKALTRLLNDADLRRKLRKNGLSTSKNERYNWNNITRRLEQIFIDRL